MWSGPFYNFYEANLDIIYFVLSDNNGEDQTALMRNLVCAFVVRMPRSQVFLQHVPPVMRKCIYGIDVYLIKKR